MVSENQFNGQSSPGFERILRRGSFTIDLVEHFATVNQKPIQLPICAFNCLVLLLRNSPKPVSFEKLAQAAPGRQLSKIEAQDKARMHIYILKKAFEQNQESSRCIQAVPGYGYWLKI